MPIVISISLSKKKEQEIQRKQKKRAKNGYPKIGDVLTAIKSGYTFIGQHIKEGHVTKGEKYTVIDNIDIISGYYHVQSDDPTFCVHLTPKILNEFFGVPFKETR